MSVGARRVLQRLQEGVPHQQDLRPQGSHPQNRPSAWYFPYSGPGAYENDKLRPDMAFKIKTAPRTDIVTDHNELVGPATYLDLDSKQKPL